MKIQSPFLETEKTPFSSEELLQILAQEPSGHYLLGNHRYWHGGVHFSDQVANSLLKDKPIQAIAEGKLVAYRLNKKYKTSTLKGKKLYYSNSFCLIKHQYTSPEGKPPRTPNAPLTKAGWVGRIVELEMDWVMRNPNATDDSHADYSFKIEMLAGSQLEIMTIDGDYVKAKIKSFARNVNDTASQGYRHGAAVTELPNLKSPPGVRKVVKEGEVVYFKAFNGEMMLGKGRDLFTEVPPKDKDVNQPANNELTFYSLYMHLVPFEEYGYLKVIFNQLKLRSGSNKKTILASSGLAAGALFEEIKRELDGNDVYAQGYLLNADYEHIQEDSKEVLYWINTGTKSEPDKYAAPLSGGSQKPAFWEYKTQIKAKALEVLQAYTIQNDNGKQTLGRLEEIPKDAVFTYRVPESIKEHTLNVVDQDESKPSTKLIECKFESGATKQLCAGNAFYLREIELTDKSLEKSFIPIFDEVVQCDIDFDVKSGAVLGHMGLYETPDLEALEAEEKEEAQAAGEQANSAQVAGNNSASPGTPQTPPVHETAVQQTPAQAACTPPKDEIDRKELGISRAGVRVKRQVHFEMFSKESANRINTFLENKAKVREGAQYLSFEPQAIFTQGTHPDSFTQESTTFTNSEQQAVPLSEMVMTKDSQGKDWCEVNLAIGDEMKKGWILKNDPLVKESSQHDWKALGYVIVEEKNDNADGCVVKHEDGFVDASCAETSTFFKDLYKAIDTNPIDGVSPSEVIAALNKPALAGKIRRIIGYHPTEWDGDATHAKWAPLEEEFKKANMQALFDHEKDRITELCFWGKVNELKDIPKVYHFHPIEFIRNMGPSLEAIRIGVDAGHGGSRMTAGKRTAFLPIMRPADSTKTPHAPWDIAALEQLLAAEYAALPNDGARNVRSDKLQASAVEREKYGDLSQVYEWDFNDVVARTVMDELALYQGVQTKRFDDDTGKEKDELITPRVSNSWSWGARHYISCHHNASGPPNSKRPSHKYTGGPEDDYPNYFDSHLWNSANYVTAMYRKTYNHQPLGATRNNEIKQMTTAMASNIGRHINNVIGISGNENGRGVYPTDDFGQINGFYKKGGCLVLVEGGFMNSESNINKLLDDNHKLHIKNLRAHGKAIAAGVAEALKLVKK